jgi:predicted kinase
MTVGLPRSGKSTWTKTQGLPIVSLDSIRLALHGDKRNQVMEPFIILTAKVMIRALFYAGHDTVILDSTCLTKSRRKEWKSELWLCKYIEFFTPKEECIERAVKNGQQDLIEVIERLSNEREPITDLENIQPY